MSASRPSSIVLLLGGALVAGLAGCDIDLGDVDPVDPTAIVDGNRGSVSGAVGKTSGEPNGTFEQSIVAVFDASGTARLQGTISTDGDLDVFLLGPLARGDRLTVDAATTDSDLDVSVAVFDDARRLVVENDDRGNSEDRFLDSLVDFITRHSGTSYYLVVASSAFSDRGRFTGSYSVDVIVTPGADVPSPAQQIIVLDYDGGTVNSPTLGSVTLAPFSAEAISTAYTGQTQILKTLIREAVAQNFERFNVVVVTSDDPPLPPSVMFSRIFLGGFDPGAFGIAENVDPYNQDFCDDAIIYSESFHPGVFSDVPTVAELAVAIGNVTTHEAGHLLGLNHVSDDRALMDDRSEADAFLEDQEFMEAPLSSDIMPIGTQDAVLLLLEIVGL